MLTRPGTARRPQGSLARSLAGALHDAQAGLPAGARRGTRLVALLIATLLAAARPAAAEDAGGAADCLRAGRAAEDRFALPAGLLAAIGRVESGRADPATGAVSAWPWTINANGSGRHFGTPEDAVATTRELQARGVASIDVGCFQINLLYHPAAFASLEEAFDPTANAAYAARFLTELRARLGSWDKAVAAYHSSTAERGEPYRDRVLAELSPAGSTSIGSTSAGPARGLEAPRLTAAPRIQQVSWTPPSSAGGIRVWTPSAPGAAPNVIAVVPARVATR